MHDKIITAVCRTVDGVEWTSLKVGQDENETLRQETIPMTFSGETTGELMASMELPEELAEQIKGDITVPLRSAELLMRVMELPATEDDEIADMILLQADKISPFPTDQIAVSHELLHRSDDASLVLLATARRDCIDAIGDAFKEKGIRIHSIDSRIMGWMQLLQDAGNLAANGCDILVVDDGIDFSLVITLNGIPIAFRLLHPGSDRPVSEELTYEIEYTLSTLDTERDLPAPTTLQYWSQESLPLPQRTELANEIGLKVSFHALGELPPLSEGIVRRALSAQPCIELIPREWVEHEQREQLLKKTLRACAVIGGVWLLVLLIFFSIYKVRDLRLSAAERRAAEVSPAAKQALENRRKLETLQDYTDRSDSALECLREVTQLLPLGGDIEFVSFKYDKSKGITIRGTAGNDAQVDNYLVSLANSKLFERIKDQSTSTTTSKGMRRTVFAATLTLPAEEAGR